MLAKGDEVPRLTEDNPGIPLYVTGFYRHTSVRFCILQHNVLMVSTGVVFFRLLPENSQKKISSEVKLLRGGTMQKVLSCLV